MKQMLKKPSNIFVAVLFVLVLAFPAVCSNQFTMNSLCLVLLYAIWGSSWNIIGGYCGQMSLGHACFVGLGGYTTAYMFQNLSISPWIGLIAGGIIAGLASLVIGIPCFKLKGSYFSLSTVAMCHVLRIFFNTTNTMFGHPTGAAQGMKLSWKGGLQWIQFLDKRGFYFVFLLFLVIVLIVSHNVKKSKLGYYLAAIRTNQDAAASLGVNVKGMKLTAYFISAFFTAIGGGLYAMFLQYIEPMSSFAYDLSIKIMVLAVVGGSGTLWGPVVGAALLVPIQQILNSRLGANMGAISIVAYGLVLMLVIYFMPKGLLAWFSKIVSKVFAKLRKKPTEKEQV